MKKLFTTTMLCLSFCTWMTAQNNEDKLKLAVSNAHAKLAKDLKNLKDNVAFGAAAQSDQFFVQDKDYGKIFRNNQRLSAAYKSLIEDEALKFSIFIEGEKATPSKISGTENEEKYKYRTAMYAKSTTEKTGSFVQDLTLTWEVTNERKPTAKLIEVKSKPASNNWLPSERDEINIKNKLILAYAQNFQRQFDTLYEDVFFCNDRGIREGALVEPAQFLLNEEALKALNLEESMKDLDENMRLHTLYQALLQEKDSIQIEMTCQISTDNPKYLKETKRPKMLLGGKPNPVQSVTTWHYTTTGEAKVTLTDKTTGELISETVNELTLTWETSDWKTHSKPAKAFIRLLSIKADSIPFLSSEKDNLKGKAEELIAAYYEEIKSENWHNADFLDDNMKIRLENSTKVEEIGKEINVDPKELIVTTANIPKIKISLDPTPYLTADTALYTYTDTTAYVTVQPTFTVDLQNSKITQVTFDSIDGKIPQPKEKFPAKEVVAESSQSEEKAPIKTLTNMVSGKHYKIQIMALDKNVPVEKLPAKFQIKGLEIEKYQLGQKIFYKYVVPVEKGRSAKAKKEELIQKGHPNAWIVGYENGKRTQPDETQVE